MKKSILRYLSLILALAMLCPVSAFAERGLYSEQEKQRYEDHVELLMKLNIIEERMDFTQTVTRAELARVLVSLASGEAAAYKGTDFGFTDVDAKTKYAGYIVMGTQLGYLTGYDDGSFRPDAMVKAEEAVCAFMRAAGYTPYAEQKGGFTSGYFEAASKSGLLKGIDVYVGYDITYMTLVQLVMNSMDIKFMEASLNGSSTRYDYCDNKFTERLGIEKRRGIVDSTSKSSLYNNGRLGERSIGIDGLVFSADGDYSDLLGYSVEYYIDTEDGDTILHMNKRAGAGKELVILSEDIVKYEDRRYSYYVNNRGKTLDLPDDIAIIYNGVSEPEPTAGMMQPSNGWVTLLDNDDDGKYDVLFITQYETYIVYYVDVPNKRIYDTYDSAKVVAIEEDEEYSIKDVNGSEVELDKIARWNVLSVRQSTNRVVTDITVCNKSVRGTVEMVDEDYIKISGTEYDRADTILGADLTVGKQAMFLFDAFDRLVAVSGSDVDGMYIGYLVRANMPEDDERIWLKIYTADGKMETIYTDKKVKMDNVSGMRPSEVLTSLKKDTDGVYPQVILYGLNADGYINKIDTAYNNKPVSDMGIFNISPENGEKKNSFRLVYPTEALYYRSAQNTFDGKINLTGSTIVFNVPESLDCINEEDFKVVGMSSFEGDKQYTCDFYSYSETDIFADICVVRGNKSIGVDKRYGVVTHAKKTINDADEPITGVTITDYRGEVSAQIPSYVDVEVKRGDFIEFDIDKDNVIVDARVVYDYSERSFLLSNPTNPSFTEPRRLLFGHVYNKDKNIISVTTNPITGDVDRSELENHTIDKYKCYLFSDNELESIPPERVLDYKHSGMAYSRVVIYSYYGEPRILVVYDER